MAAPLPEDTVDPVAVLIRELESADWRSDALLRRAVDFAGEISPTVVATVEQAANGAYLLPHQQNLLLWGIHVLGAAKRTELFRPLLRLVTLNREDFFERLLGDVVTETLPRIFISTFDGDADAMIEALADRTVDSYVRWSLFDALARLTFECRVRRQKTQALLDRFEREPLADPGDPVWQGWVDTITHLGIEELYDSIRKVWDDGRISPDDTDRDLVEERLVEARTLPPGDPTMFVKYGRMPIDDPAKALAWTAVEGDKRQPKHDKRRVDADPAAGIALNDQEIDWLEGFLRSDKVPANAMTLEQTDGFLSALACGPPVPPNEYLPVIWDTSDDLDPQEPNYDSAQQEKFVERLLQRHLDAITRRLDRGYLHGVIVETDTDELPARYWAAGFLRGVALRTKEWGAQENSFIIEFLQGVVALGTDAEHLRLRDIDFELRDKLVAALPKNLLRLYQLWRGHDDPYPPPVDNYYEGRKIGRNEPCPCGSGKKFKFCCGSRSKGDLH